MISKTNPNPSQDRVEEKRCPLCAWPAMAMQKLRHNGSWAVVCNNDGTCGDDVEPCGLIGPERLTEAEAIAAWNTRPESESVTVMQEALEQIADTPNAGWIIARATLAKLSHGSVGS